MSTDDELQIEDVAEYPLTLFFMTLNKEKDDYNDLVLAIRNHDLNVISNVVQILQKFSFKINWIDAVLGIILERIDKSTDKEKVDLALIIEDLIYVSISNGYYTSKIARLFDNLDILMKNIVNDHGKYLFDYENVLKNYRELLRLQNKEGREVIAQMVQKNGMMIQ